MRTFIRVAAVATLLLPLQPGIRAAQSAAAGSPDPVVDAATKLIGEIGSDAMRMSELARRAGMSIGALYQYFPDKAAILRTLAERYNAAGRQCIAEGLAGVTTADSLQAAFGWFSPSALRFSVSLLKVP